MSKPYCRIRKTAPSDRCDEEFIIRLAHFPATDRGAKTAAKQKWALLAKFCKEHPGVTITGYGSDSCALCEFYLGLGCSGCPIEHYTGITACGGTPFDHLPIGHEGSKEFQQACERMSEFLNRILK